MAGNHGLDKVWYGKAGSHGVDKKEQENTISHELDKREQGMSSGHGLDIGNKERKATTCTRRCQRKQVNTSWTWRSNGRRVWSWAGQGKTGERRRYIQDKRQQGKLAGHWLNKVMLHKAGSHNVDKRGRERQAALGWKRVRRRM